MFNIKTAAALLGATLAILLMTAPSLEAGHCRGHHCRKSTVSLNISPTYVTPCPTYVVQSPAYVVNHAYYQPVYTAPMQEVREVIVCPTPVYRPVYVAPQPRLFTGFSFNWFSH